MKLISRLLATKSIKIENGKASSSKGQPSSRLSRELASLCSELGIRNCEIFIQSDGSCRVSREVPKSHLQKFRNVISINS